MGSRLSGAVVAAEEARVNSGVDVARRAAEKSKAEEARRATEEQRMQLAAEQRRLEEERRLRPSEGSVQGSVWNAGSWHWEEKKMNSWAYAWLQNKLASLTMKLFGGLASVTLSNVSTSGDASVSVRKGRPIALFLLCIECTWSVTESAAGV